MLQLAEISQAVAVVVACFAIVSGIGAWKREFIGKRRIELAESLLAKFFEVKDDIAFIRSPFGRVSEGESRQREADESPEDSGLLDRGYVVIERYQQKQATFVDFNTLKYRCMASFGPETESIFVDTNRALNSIFASAQMLAHHYWKRQGRVHMEPDEFKKHLEEMHGHEGISGTAAPMKM